MCLRSAGSPDAKGVKEAFAQDARTVGTSQEEFEQRFAENTLLKRLPRLKEIARAAVLVASDKASARTQQSLILTAASCQIRYL